MKEQLYFKTNAKMEKLIGRELITNSSIAIFELVKNSYDANAKEVTIKFRNFSYNDSKRVSTSESSIEIIDDGDGMSLSDIKNYWMELGTPYKENLKKELLRENSKNIEIISKRMLNGEKGIGRFGVDKIGHRLKLISIDKSGLEESKVEFNWDLFDDTKKQIGEIPCIYEHRTLKSPQKSGTTLIISELRDEWGSKDINKLRTDVQKFLSPIPFESDNFNIIFEFIHKDENSRFIREREKIENNSFDYLKSYIDVTLSKDGIMEGEVILNNKKTKSISETLFLDGSPFGSIEAKIYFLDKGEKSVFSKKMGIKTREYGNIKIYRGNFRVMPYGEAHNDWLEIDNRHSQGIFRTFGTRDIIGYILLDGDNSRLREATDRVGFIEDDVEYLELKKVIWEIIKNMETETFNQLKTDTNEASKVLKLTQSNLKNNVNDFVNDLQTVLEKSNVEKEIIKKIVSDSLSIKKDFKKIEKASKEVEKKIKIYEKLLTREEFITKVLHEVQNKVAFFKAQSFSFETFAEEVKEYVDIDAFSRTVNTIERLIKGALSSVTFSTNKKTKLSIKQIINETEKFHKKILEQKNIELIIENNLSKDKKILGDSSSLENVFENLFSNSIKALENIENKKIKIALIDEKERVNILFSDNGNGIEEDKIPLIFSLWSSFQEKTGSGIGLSLIKNIIDEHKGEIHYIDSDLEFETTFLLSFKQL